jgi:hypothetical protein
MATAGQQWSHTMFEQSIETKAEYLMKYEGIKYKSLHNNIAVRSYRSDSIELERCLFTKWMASSAAVL